jgi:hypothetical protein
MKIPRKIGKIAMIFLMISKLRKISDRPFTFKMLRFIACNGYSIPARQIICKLDPAVIHFVPIKTRQWLGKKLPDHDVKEKRGRPNHLR